MRAVLLCVLAGCSFPHGALGQQPSDGPATVIDAPRDAPRDTMLDACVSYSTLVDTCNVPAGGDQPLLLTGTNTYNTTTNVLSLSNGTTTNPPHRIAGNIDVLFVTDFTIGPGATLQVAGTLPVGIAAAGMVTIAGTLSGHAGARSRITCGAGAGGNGSPNDNGAGGGGGGAFRGGGGIGGDGDLNGTTTFGGGRGSAAARPITLVGGCPGGNGGFAANGFVEGAAGGGAFLVAARTSITVNATGIINAGGAGGNGGNARDRGGGGGGSGGMIILESGSVTIAGVLAANGGAGGEGAGNGNGNAGQRGQPSATAAAGGNGGDVEGGDGGNGAAAAALNGSDSTEFLNGAGGGGGGGVGYIAINSAAPTVTGTISPSFGAWP